MTRALLRLYTLKVKLHLSMLALTFYGVQCQATPAKITLVTENLPPYQIIGKNNHDISGFAYDIVKETFKRSKINYSLAAYPWVRSYKLSLNNPNTCIFSIARIPIREAKYTWIGQITEKNNAVVWGLKTNKHSQQIQTLDDLKKYVIAVNQDDVTHLGMLKNGFKEGKHLYLLQNTNSLINLLVTRSEIDFIIADDITISYRADLAGVDINLLQRVLEIDNLPLDFYLACNKKTDKKVIATLTDKLAEIHQDGTYLKILAHWKNKMPRLK